MTFEEMRKRVLGKKLYLQLNPTPRSPTHGPNRRPSPKAHRDPSNGTDQGAGGTYTLRTALPPAGWTTLAGGTDQKGSGASLSFTDSWFEPYELKPPILPYAGIRTGEIIGHRAWWVLSDGLYSIAHMFRWAPGATIEGDLNQLIYRDMYHFDRHIWGGVYAYANASLVNIECSQLQRALYGGTRADRSHPANFAIGLVCGTVKLWGEVIEHKVGWRAQYAKLASIEETWGDQLRLREILEPYHASLKEKS